MLNYVHLKSGLTALARFTSIKSQQIPSQSQSAKPSQSYLTFCQKNPTNYYCLTNSKPAGASETVAQPENINKKKCVVQKCLYVIPPNTQRICARSGNNYKTFLTTCALNNYNCQNGASK